MRKPDVQFYQDHSIATGWAWNWKIPAMRSDGRGYKWSGPCTEFRVALDMFRRWTGDQQFVPSLNNFPED